MNHAALQQSILKTLAYFDLFDYPLTREELYNFLWQPPALTYEEFTHFLDQENDVAKYENKDGYYFLPGKEKIIVEKNLGLINSEKRLKKARRAAKVLSSVPFLRAIFVCNTVGAGTAKEDSDIDFFVVSAPRRTWLVRFFCNLILRFLRWRTYGDKVANRICLSFFVDEKHLDLSPYRVINDDIHFAYWTQQMIQIYDPESLCGLFLQANNWVKQYLPYANGSQTRKYIREVKKGKFGGMWKKIWETMWGAWYGDLLESQARDWQKMKMKLSVKKRAEKPDKAVILGEGIIKLHENDSRARWREEWKMSTVKLL